MTSARLYFIHALSPLHAGTGQGIGAIDLPIAREKATNIPYVPGSSLKGVLRDRCAQDGALKDRLVPVFGPETENAADHAGSLVLADARLLLLPVRSLIGTFAWVTSPYLLRRFVRDAAEGVTESPSGALPGVPAAPAMTGDRIECLVAPGAKIVMVSGGTRSVYLEDLDLIPRDDGAAQAWAGWLGKRLWPGDDSWQAMLAERICIVPDDLMSYLVGTATEIIARIRMEPDRKTVADGGLWYEEALPAETVLTGLALAAPVKAAHLADTDIFATLETLTRTALQLGGKATVGRGLCRVLVAGQSV